MKMLIIPNKINPGTKKKCRTGMSIEAKASPQQSINNFIPLRILSRLRCGRIFA